MLIKESISFLLLEGQTDGWIDNVCSYMKSHVFEKENTFGFKDVFSDEFFVEATLLRKSKVSMTSFDYETMGFVKKDIDFFTKCDFRIDSKLGILEYYGPLKDLQKLRSSLNPTFNDMSVSYPSMPANKIIEALMSEIRGGVKIERLVISDLKYKDGMFGRYDAKITDNEAGIELIKEYAENVLQYSLAFYSDAKITLSCNGRLAIECEEGDLEKVISIIKQTIIKYG
jgi:hypothetical protein